MGEIQFQNQTEKPSKKAATCEQLSNLSERRYNLEECRCDASVKKSAKSFECVL